MKENTYFFSRKDIKTKIKMATSSNESNLKKNKIFKYLIPSLVGIVIGLCGYILYLSKAHSYLSDDPKACVNCQIMEPE